MNGRIRAREVRVIIAASKQQLGIMKTPDALRRAQSLGLDLVEIAPTANPPVCQIVDFGKFRYEQNKMEKERHHSQARVKELKFRVNIDEHDFVTKLRQAENFLDKGSKVKTLLRFRGREMAHQELGEKLMVRVREELSTMGQVEMPSRKTGNTITMVLAPLPPGKRKRKFKIMDADEEAAAEAADAADGHEEPHDEAAPDTADGTEENVPETSNEAAATEQKA